MSDWMIVLNRRDAVKWVLREQRMAFRDSVKTDSLRAGDNFILYTTRGTYGAPNKDESQILAVGQVLAEVAEGRVRVGTEFFQKSCSIRIDMALPLRGGVPLRPLVEELEFIKKKRFWSAYVYRTLVLLQGHDFELLRDNILRHRSSIEASSGSSTMSAEAGSDQGSG